MGQSKVLPCSLGAAGAFQPLQPLHSEEHTWASPRIAILEPCPSNKPPLAEHLWGKISPPGFAQMGKPRHGQVAEVAFGPDGEAAAQGSCTPAQTSTNECSNTFPDLCGPPGKAPGRGLGFLLGHRKTDRLHIQHAASTSPSISRTHVTSHRDARSVPLPGGACAGLQLTQLPNSLEMIDIPKVTTVSHLWENWTHTRRSGHGLVGMRCTAETQRELGDLLQHKH